MLSTLWMAVWADAPLKSYKDIPSPERNARLITEAMQSRLGLTEKQYKKVYKIQLAEQKTIFKYKPTPQRGIEKDLGEMPLQGHRMEGGRPHRGGGFEGMGGGRPPMPPREMDWGDDRPDPEKIAKNLTKAAQKRDKKLKKVLDKGQYEASHVLGFRKSYTFFHIILPQVIKKIMPALGNEVITLVKDTALAQTIGVAELFRVAQTASSREFSTVPIFIAGIFYFVMNYIVSRLFTIGERKLDYYR